MKMAYFAFPPLQKLSKLPQQTASVITKERLLIKSSANFPKMNAIQTNENSFLTSPAVFEKVGPTISKCFSSTRACAWGDIVPLTELFATRYFPHGVFKIKGGEKLTVTCDAYF